jgi:hypothetical protein
MRRINPAVFLFSFLVPSLCSGWVLKDEFDIAVSAGHVNGTSAQPMGGTRTATDTESKLSVSGGRLTFSGGKASPAYGDPAIWYPAVARTAGRTGIFHFNTDSGAARLGFDINQTTTLLADYIRINSDGSTLSGYLGADTEIGSYTAGIDYYFADVLRESGSYYFIRGGTEYPRWTLLQSSYAGSTSPVYPNINNYSGVFLSSFVRIPDRLFLPTPLCYGTFASALSCNPAGPDAQPAQQPLWTGNKGTWGVSSGAAIATTTDTGIAIATVPASTADVVISAALTRSTGQIGLVVRWTDSDNYVYAYHDGTNAVLAKVSGGIRTTVITAAAAYSTGANLTVVADGTGLGLYYNNSRIGSTSITGGPSGTSHGIYADNTTDTLDDFTLFPRGTDGEYGRLDVLMERDGGRTAIPTFPDFGFTDMTGGD